jgi:2-polyprenyl-3-methyl-5-hydroxy-6-metoxy-1,4-benzoquinol methylase
MKLGIIGGSLGYQLLRRIAPGGKGGYMAEAANKDQSKLTVLFGPQIWNEITGKTVIDFGCGTGQEVVELVLAGARHVIGLDIQEHLLAQGRKAASRAEVADRCEFCFETDEKADVIICVDAFEHFEEPADILTRMSEMLAPRGKVLISFGWSWYHPFGGHLFSVFP